MRRLVPDIEEIKNGNSMEPMTCKTDTKGGEGGEGHAAGGGGGRSCWLLEKKARGGFISGDKERAWGG